VHASPSSHASPSALLLQLVVEVAGAHTSHTFAGFAAPAAMSTPPMKHSTAHPPPLQT
jgi:hypothetical protein